jgi:osmotically-inducible protein OsmY
MRMTLMALGALAAVAAASACTQRSRPNLAEQPTTSYRLSEEATGIDGSVETQVQRRLDDDPVVGKYDLRVAATERGVVTLYGTVPTEDQRVRAARVASDVSGVKRIDNEIAVRRPDPDIVRETY